MKGTGIYGLTLVLLILTGHSASRAWGDGGYVSRSGSVAISADQRVIIVKSGGEISMTLFTGYTGEGEDFGWLVPIPVPPAIENVNEAGENAEAAFTRET